MKELIRSARRGAVLLAVITAGIVACDGAQTTEPEVAVSGSATRDVINQTYTSGSNVTAWDAILPASADPNWTSTICTTNPQVGPNANWQNPHPSYVLTGHPWANLYFGGAPWINAWNTTGSVGPGGQNWSKYQTSVSGNGSFVIKLLADNCSWVYLDGILVGVQPVNHNAANTQYGLTLNGTHTLSFIIFDGGGAAGGKFILETTTNPPPPLNPDLDGDGHANTSDKFPLDPTEWADTDSDGKGDNSDAFPTDPTEQLDSDGDGFGDNSDAYPNDPTRFFKDTDADGRPDVDDNCPAVVNPEQTDLDGDGVGDACDMDVDGDGAANSSDNCGVISNSDQTDLDRDGRGDACDDDIDGDGVPNESDAYPKDPTRSSFDADDDGVIDEADNCPAVSNASQADLDRDGRGDACDTDIDGDGVDNGSDAFPTNPAESVDSDGDGVGNNSDAFPNDPRESVDGDRDGVGNNGDNCPSISNPRQEDLDRDRVGDACDSDIDGDGVDNRADAFPTNPAESVDSDGDGVGNNSDAFPNDPRESVDGDRDGVGDNGDNCRSVSNASQADLDHDGIGDACDTDIDGDGVANGSDAFPTNPAESVDSDGDGVGNNADAYDNSNTGPALVVGTCNTGVANWHMGSGTYANDLIAAAYASAANHGAFVNAVTDLSNGWKKAGKITGQQHGAIVSCAAHMK